MKVYLLSRIFFAFYQKQEIAHHVDYSTISFLLVVFSLTLKLIFGSICIQLSGAAPSTHTPKTNTFSPSFPVTIRVRVFWGLSTMTEDEDESNVHVCVRCVTRAHDEL